MPGNQGLLFAAVMLSVTAQKEKRLTNENSRRTIIDILGSETR